MFCYLVLQTYLFIYLLIYLLFVAFVASLEKRLIFLNPDWPDGNLKKKCNGFWMYVRDFTSSLNYTLYFYKQHKILVEARCCLFSGWVVIYLLLNIIHGNQVLKREKAFILSEEGLLFVSTKNIKRYS